KLLESTRLAKTAQTKKELADAKKDYEATYKNLIQRVKEAQGSNRLNMSPEELGMLGLKHGDQLYSLLQQDPRSLISQQKFDPNKFISKEEQASLAQLDALASLYGGKVTNPYTMENLAGTQTMENSLDASKFAKRQDELEKDFNKRYRTDKLSINLPGGSKMTGTPKEIEDTLNKTNAQL